MKEKQLFGVAAGGGLASQGDIKRLQAAAAPLIVQKRNETSVQRPMWFRLSTQPLVLTFGQGRQSKQRWPHGLQRSGILLQVSLQTTLRVKELGSSRPQAVRQKVRV